MKDAEGPTRGPRSRILVVAGDASTRSALRSALGEGGFETEGVSSAHAAFTVLDRSPVRLIVADLTGPRLDGAAFIKRCRATLPDVPVVIVTAMPPEDAKVVARMLGARGFVNKPLELHAVLSQVAAVLAL